MFRADRTPRSVDGGATICGCILGPDLVRGRHLQHGVQHGHRSLEAAAAPWRGDGSIRDTWLRPDPPEGIRRHWNAEYPEIATASEKIAILERAGYDLLGYFVLPPTDWIDNYYEPTAERLPAFLERHAGGPEADEVVAMERQEADLYKRYQKWFSYGFYVVRKR